MNLAALPRKIVVSQSLPASGTMLVVIVCSRLFVKYSDSMYVVKMCIYTALHSIYLDRHELFFKHGHALFSCCERIFIRIICLQFRNAHG